MHLLITLLVFLVIASVVWWAVGMLPLPGPIRPIVLVVLVIIFLIVMLGYLPGAHRYF